MNHGPYSFDFSFFFTMNLQHITGKIPLHALPKTVKCDRSRNQFKKKIIKKIVARPSYQELQMEVEYAPPSKKQQQQQQWKCRVYYYHCHFHNYTQNPPPSLGWRQALYRGAPKRTPYVWRQCARNCTGPWKAKRYKQESEGVAETEDVKKKILLRVRQKFHFPNLRRQINSDDNDWCTNQ